MTLRTGSLPLINPASELRGFRCAVFYLSSGQIDRMELTIQAVRMALMSHQSMIPL